MTSNNTEINDQIDTEGEITPTMESFFQRADEIITVANGQVSEDSHLGQVGASLIYAATRYAAFSASVGFQNGDDYISEKEKMIDFYTKQFNTMLADNIDNYGKNFDEYLQVSQK